MSSSGYIETYRGLVMPQEADAFGHMGTAYYMAKFTVALGQLYGRRRPAEAKPRRSVDGRRLRILQVLTAHYEAPSLTPSVLWSTWLPATCVATWPASCIGFQGGDIR